FIWDTVVESINGEDKVTSLTLKNRKTGETTEFPIEGVFVYIGMVPLSEPFKSLELTNEEGYIPTNQDMETNVTGVFAANAIREKTLSQIVPSTGNCSIADE